MKRNDAFPKKFLSKDDVAEPLKVTIAGVSQREIANGDETEIKTVLEFEGSVKPMVLNSTNWDILETNLGIDSDMWMGKPITLYVDPNVAYAGKKIGGVRVRIERLLTDAEKWMLFLKENPTVTDAIVRQALAAPKPSEWMAKDKGRTVEQAIDKVKEVLSQAVAEKF